MPPKPRKFRLLGRLGLALLLAGLAACQAPTPAPPPPLAGPVSAGAVAIDPAGRRLAAVNPDSGSITLVALDTLTVEAEVATGADPRTLSFTPDGLRLLVANHGAGTLSVIDTEAGQVIGEVAVGALPYGVVAGSQNAYVSLAGVPQVVVVDLATLAVSAAVPVQPFPTGLALSADQAHLYVTHLYTGTVSVLDAATLSVQTIATAAPQANLAQFIALSADGTRAYVPQTYSFAERLELAYDHSVQPVVGVLAFDKDTSTTLPLATADESVNLPFALAISPDQARLYVANAGSDNVSVLDTATPIGLGLAGATLARLNTGRNPRGLALSADGSQLYVNNVLDGTLDVFDTATLARVQTVPLTHIPLPADVLEGKRLFNSARAPMSAGNWLSCATCHLDGGADGRTWLGFPDGPRNTPTLAGAASTLPLHWNGDLDELQDTEQTIRVIQGGAGLIAGEVHPSQGPANAGRSAALDALAAYLSTLTPPPSPYAADAATLERGAKSFARWGCEACHRGPDLTDQKTHNGEVGDPALERHQTGPLPRFDTPALTGAWATAPYFHDGSAATLRDVLFSQGFHNMGPGIDAAEMTDLLAYMQAQP